MGSGSQKCQSRCKIVQHYSTESFAAICRFLGELFTKNRGSPSDPPPPTRARVKLGLVRLCLDTSCELINPEIRPEEAIIYCFSSDITTN